MPTTLRTLLTLLLTALLLAAPLASLWAQPMGYSVNSDSGTANADSLYEINLATGAETRIAPVRSLGQIRLDVEGLAFAPDGTLYGVDDDTLTLFPLNPDNAVIDHGGEVLIKGLPIGGVNDFGMTFACDGNLYITSIAQGSLYRMDLKGNTTLVGSSGSLNPVKISGLAAYGNPVKLYGLGNGLRLLPDETPVADTPNLYEIDPQTGVATKIGALTGPAEQYFQGGLAFDDAGQLWAITDRRQLGLASQVMKLDLGTGKASQISTLAEQGFESLAITVPRGCQVNNNTEIARFRVQKQYVDGNDVTPATLNLRCNSGLPLEQSLDVMPNAGPFGAAEVEFTVDNFEDGALDCQVYETAPANYSPSYECFSEGACSESESACSFSDVSGGQDNLCVIRNYPDPVQVNVATEWLFNSDELIASDYVNIDLVCTNAHGGDGLVSGNTISWNWLVNSESAPITATLYPLFDGSTRCRTEVSVTNSAIESTSDCDDWTPVALGDGTLTCTVSNTVFFEGIPTLGPLGLALASLLLLGTGLVAARRF